MSKFLYFQDFHISGKNSAHYISDYFNNCLLMLDEILEIAKKNKVEAILDGGDLLHTPEPTYRIIDEIVDRVEKYKIPIYSLFGNHAERYHSMEHSRYTGQAHIIKRSKYFNYLDRIKDNDFVIEGIEYSHNIEEELKNPGRLIFSKGFEKSWKIAIVHAFICKKEFPYASHVVCDDITTNADVVLVAHYHAQWEKKVGNTLFKDIGCLGRRSITEKDIIPCVLLIDTNTRTLKEIPLKSAKSGNEIFDILMVDSLKDKEHTIDNFIKSIEDIQFQKMEIADMVKYIGKEKGVNPEVVDLIIDKIKVLKNE